MTRPFPSDPQWLQLSRKLPPDAVIERLLRFGFRGSDIAAHFEVESVYVTQAKERLGLKMHPIGAWQRRRNGAAPASRYFG
jgi:hypothetical protein